MVLEISVKTLLFFTAFSSGQRILGWAVFCCLTFFIGVAMAEERDIKIRQNSIVSIFDEILVVSLLEIFGVFWSRYNEVWVYLWFN